MNDGLDSATGWLSEHGPRLVLLARQWVGSHADAEDVCQEAFIRFWPHRYRVRDPLAYLYRCVRNAAMNRQRSDGRRQVRESRNTPGPVFDDQPGERIEQAEFQQAVQRAMEHLTTAQREVLVMRMWGELTFAAIAEALGVPVRTAQSRCRDALAALRSHLSIEWTE